MKILKTVIGSFPRLDNSDLRAFDAAVKLQERNGIDLLSDGEQRGDMIFYLAQSIPGLGIENGHPIICGRITPPEDPMKVHKVKDYFHLKRKYPDLTFKVSLTGPTTLAIGAGSKKICCGYKNYIDPALTADLAAALKEVVKPLAKAKAYLQIDEPFFSQGFRDLADRIKLVDDILEGYPRELCSIHVCGWLGRQPVLEELAKLENVEVISHAFSTGMEKENVKLLKHSLFKDTGKKLGAGIISVSPIKEEDIESPETVADRLDKIVSKIGGVEKIGFVHPDCGLRATREDLVEGILCNFNEGVRLYLER
jgi:5-methyltetrahydropteroyltriglutamate--homocysteine methyltransferase